MTEGPLFYVHAHMAYRVLNSGEGGLQEYEIIVQKFLNIFITLYRKYRLFSRTLVR